MKESETQVRIRFPKPADFTPEPVFSDGHKWAGRPRCTAWNPNAGRQCERLQSKIPGVDKCNSHGGKSRRGVDHPNFRTGKYTVPSGIEAAYLKQRTDPALLELREELALIDSRIMEITADLDGTQAESVFNEVKKKTEELLDALHTDPFYKFRVDTVALELFRITHEGIDYYFRWKEITELIEVRRRLVETDRKRDRDLFQFLTYEQLLGIIGQIIEVIRPELTNDKQRNRIADKIRRILN